MFFKVEGVGNSWEQFYCNLTAISGAYGITSAMHRKQDHDA